MRRKADFSKQFRKNFSLKCSSLPPPPNHQNGVVSRKTRAQNVAHIFSKITALRIIRRMASRYNGRRDLPDQGEAPLKNQGGPSPGPQPRAVPPGRLAPRGRNGMEREQTRSLHTHKRTFRGQERRGKVGSLKSFLWRTGYYEAYRSPAFSCFGEGCFRGANANRLLEIEPVANISRCLLPVRHKEVGLLVFAQHISAKGLAPCRLLGLFSPLSLLAI